MSLRAIFLKYEEWKLLAKTGESTLFYWCKWSRLWKLRWKISWYVRQNQISSKFLKNLQCKLWMENFDSLLSCVFLSPAYGGLQRWITSTLSVCLSVKTSLWPSKHPPSACRSVTVSVTLSVRPPLSVCQRVCFRLSLRHTYEYTCSTELSSFNFIVHVYYTRQHKGNRVLRRVFLIYLPRPIRLSAIVNPSQPHEGFHDLVTGMLWKRMMLRWKAVPE